MPIVEFNRMNCDRCLCYYCPVQHQSSCTKEHTRLVEQTPGVQMPDPATIDRLFCSAGESSCDDLDDTRPCLCGSCPVWKELDLGAYYYCFSGSAG